MSEMFLQYLMHCLSGVKVSSISMEPDFEWVTATELDSHVDLPVVGKYAWILKGTGRRATVSEFTSDLGKPLSVPIVNAAIAYNCKYTGATFQKHGNKSNTTFHDEACRHRSGRMSKVPL